jgi:hypothetical protein
MLWNNPFIIRHFRAQFRPGKIIVVVACYLLVIAVIAVVCWSEYSRQSKSYFNNYMATSYVEKGNPFAQIKQPSSNDPQLIQALKQIQAKCANDFFLALVFFQAAIMFFIGGLTASVSTSQEISKKTWEFTQTASYPPNGKVLGEVFGRSILLNSTLLLFLPLAAICFLLDAVSVGRILRITLWLISGATFFSALAVASALLNKRLIASALAVMAFCGFAFMGSLTFIFRPAAWVAISPDVAAMDSDALRFTQETYSHYFYFNRGVQFLDFFHFKFDPAYLGIALYSLMALLFFYIIRHSIRTFPNNILPRIAPIYAYLVVILAAAGSCWSQEARLVVIVTGILAALMSFAVSCAQAPNREKVFDNIWRNNANRFNVLKMAFSENSSPTVFLAFMLCLIVAVGSVLDRMAFPQEGFAFAQLPFNEGGGPLLIYFFVALQYCELDQLFLLLLGKAGHALALASVLGLLIVGAMLGDTPLGPFLNPFLGVGRWGYDRDLRLTIALLSAIGGTVLLICLRLRYQSRLKKEMNAVIAKLEEDTKEFSTLSLRRESGLIQTQKSI